MVGLGVRISPGCFFLVENDPQSQRKKWWDILLKVAGDEEQKGTHGPWPLMLYPGLASSPLPNFDPSGWFSFVPELLALTL